ncbi:translation factor SUA5 [Carnobacterium iners]|uniref:Threonylcarbamoyl-AMP synthase n=1 Tax=Carnobacterium iners TaxID=1073423 RepID=A0A1X7N783_9LACT|nr:L-threonylcarbamoyladenylate synthase [Carnobacterium iners]SEK44773.1 translation factor SUA5 [Carnobacterium iners]SMH32816.1 translation factor SUA5 [Carnobacterium iners]
MDTKLFQLTEIKEAAGLLKAGELISFPTETVYGLGANAMDEAAVKKVYAAKGRPSDNPLIVHVASVEEVEKYVGEISKQAKDLMAKFWPGPLTLIFNVKTGVFSETVTGGLASVALRMPDNAATLALIKYAGVPLVGPSANTSGKPSPTMAAHVYHDLHGKIAGILDGGATGLGLESTVLDMTNPEEPTILRPGAITKEELELVVEKVYLDQHLVSKDERPKAPGMKYTHYAPNEPVVIVDGTEEQWRKAIMYYKNLGEQVGLLANENRVNQYKKEVTEVFSLGNKDNTTQAAKALYAGLRFFEKTAVTLILAEAYDSKGIGGAYMNRLEKAAGNHYFLEKESKE